MGLSSVTTTASLSDHCLNETERIWGLIRSHYTGPNGLVNYFVNPYEGKVLRRRNTIQDYGDYVQYAAWAGQVLKDSSLTSWANDQILIGSRLFQTSQGFFLPAETTDQMRRPVAYAHYFKLEDNSDLLMGMVSTYRLTGDSRLREPIDRLMDFVEKHTKSTLSGNIFFVSPVAVLPLPFHLTDGLFIEELVHLYRLTQKKEYLNLAARIEGQWKQSAYYQQTGVYPIAEATAFRGLFRHGWFPGIERRLRSSYFIKSNTNVLSGQLALYQETGDAEVRERIVRWLGVVEEHLMRPDGFLFGQWSPDWPKALVGSYPVADNHHLMNILEDASFVLQESKYLDLAERNARFWLEKRSRLGFFPELYKPGHERSAVLDMQVDYLITLLKLNALTNKSLYWDAVVAGTEALLEHFNAPYGLKWCINADTGENLKPHICSKFLSLFTKLLLLVNAVMKGGDVYADPLLYDMSRDR